MTRAAASTIIVFAVVGILFLCAIGGCNGAESTGKESMSEHTYNLPTDIAAIPNLIEGESFSVDLIEVGPWYNRMPVVGGDGTGTHHLVATAVIVNRTEQPAEAALVDTYMSFDENELGEKIPYGEFTLINEEGMPGGDVVKNLPPQSFKNLMRFRGEELFGPGHEDQMMYLTLVLQIGEETFIARRAGKVVVAM